MRAADYIANTLAEEGINRVFTVTGGGAMFLNDAFGHHPDLTCVYQHHEQACAMAAEAYARLHNKPAVVCVTSGPAAVNAMTGVLGAWMESIPMIVISGQVRTAVTVRSTGLDIRTMGIQEFDITKAAKAMTKYAVMIEDKTDMRCALEKAIYLAECGRPGPVWLDIPLDMQSADIDPEALRPFDPGTDLEGLSDANAGWYADIAFDMVDLIIEKIRTARRPVLFGGAGVRLAGAAEAFRKLVRVLNIPVTVGASSVDLLPYIDALYVGVSGVAAGRPGNFALQNADVYFSIGSRQSLSQTGFAYKDWAREAYTILNDVDEAELRKPNLHVDLPVIGDAGDLIIKLLFRLEELGYSEDTPLFNGPEAKAWSDRCREWKMTYPVVTPEMKKEMPDGRGNIYAFYDALSLLLPDGEVVIGSCGTSRVAGTQAFKPKKNQRFITNSQTASMGYDLPAAVGCAVEKYEEDDFMTLEAYEAMGSGLKEEVKPQDVTLVTGEGSIMMNLQELQTIATHKLPVRIFIMDNEGYHSIRQTQKNFFGGEPVGIGPESGDLGFPDFEKIAGAFGFTYAECLSNATMKKDVKAALELPRPMICRVAVSPLQATEPKASSRRLADGTMVSAPLEDMAPFLSREELAANMAIPLTKEEMER